MCLSLSGPIIAHAHTNGALRNAAERVVYKISDTLF